MDGLQWFILEHPMKTDVLDWFGSTTHFRKPPNIINADDKCRTDIIHNSGRVWVSILSKVIKNPEEVKNQLWGRKLQRWEAQIPIRYGELAIQVSFAKENGMQTMDMNMYQTGFLAASEWCHFQQNQHLPLHTINTWGSCTPSQVIRV